MAVRPDRSAESPVSFECRLERVVEFEDGGVPTAAVIFGRIVWCHVREDLMTESGSLEARRVQPLARLGQEFYSTIGEMHDRKRPSVKG